MTKNSLAGFAFSGTTFTVRVTLDVRAEKLVIEDTLIKIAVTMPPQACKANLSVIALLSKALGAPRSRLNLVQGQTSRTKQARLDQPAFSSREYTPSGKDKDAARSRI